MKVLVQRVSRAEVRIGGQVKGSIGAGFLVLLGIEKGDTPEDAEYLADKTADLRVFPDQSGSMNRSLLESRGEALVVSQFTLAGSTRRGRRPSFAAAALPADAAPMYHLYVARLAHRGVRVATGVFQAMMEVEMVNDGPVTILLDPPPGKDAP